MKKIILTLIAISVFISSFSFNISADSINSSKSALAVKEIYSTSDIVTAFEQYEDSGVENSVLQDVLKPTSLGIAIPNIDLSKIESKVKLKDLAEKDVFLHALQYHGVDISNAEEMSYTEFSEIESKWILEPEIIEIIKSHYPELEDVDMSTWTYGMYKTYYKEKNVQDLKGRFTDVQLAELNRRGILVEDTLYLLKEFHQPDVLLKQSDSVLKLMIEDCYRFNFSMTLGDLEEVKELNINSNVRSLPSNKQNRYTWVDFPLYGGDWFCNDILTSAYWREKQANRTLKTQCYMYDTLFTQTTLKCTNMYGTYSQSQGGAHEGIDFAAAAGAVPIYSPLWGNTIPPQKYHQIVVYDTLHYDGPQSYSFLHFSSKTSETSIGVTDLLGYQGMEGNANGYHVHFEVHGGQTNALSSGTDDYITSLSPYRLTPYIGEAG